MRFCPPNLNSNLILVVQHYKNNSCPWKHNFIYWNVVVFYPRLLSTMLTKKENLLIRPWIVQRYRAHREKVKSAGPRIDFRSPPNRVHVRVKEKKRQKESERKNEIELENIRLLQRLTVIMNTLRLDNFWRTPRPKWAQRSIINFHKKCTFSLLQFSKPPTNLQVKIRPWLKEKLYQQR